MSVDTCVNRFVFCDETEAKSIIKRIDEYNQNPSKDYEQDSSESLSSISYESYDSSHRGIMLLGSYRYGPDLTDRFAGENKSVSTWVSDPDPLNWCTNDKHHIVFPKYLIDDVEYKSDEEVLEGIKQCMDSFEDNPLSNPDIPNPENNFDDYLDYCQSEFYSRGVWLTIIRYDSYWD